MLFARLVETSQQVAATRSRNKKIALLADLLSDLLAEQSEDLEIAIPYLQGELRQGKVGLGWATVREARGEQRASVASLTLDDVDQAFSEIGSISGTGSKAARTERLAALFAAATSDEQGFLARLIGGELRQGALEAILLEAVASAGNLASEVVRRAAMVGGSLREVALTALREGEQGLERFGLQVHRPLQPMLAGTAESTEQVLEQLGRAAFEWKLDGARVQVHKQGEEVRVFSRRLHDVSKAVPEITEVVRDFPADSLVLDGEVLAFDEERRPRPFQVTMSRFGRRLDVEQKRREVPLTPIFFDVLYIDGEELLDAPSEQRWQRLDRIVPERFKPRRLVTNEAEAAEAFFDEAIAGGYEGVVAKALDASYEAGRRGKRWLKLKPTHTLDLVVLAAEWGSGRRRGWLSNLHLGARDPEGGFVMLGKTFKGMTDQILEWQTSELLARETRKDGHVVQVRPELVVEIAFDGVQASPQYPGGVALRFARLVRYRDDKTVEQADTIDAVQALYEQ